MFAIVDIETTGGHAAGERITEICILVHDGLTVVDKFSTLINPERRITPFITNLTGITNSMVEDAPKFYEVAKEILEYTRDKIFVAHNVNFDYNFIKAEFASLGYTFKREKLCTVRLSRQLLPKRVSYSLGNLCESLGIDNEARHRAEGDAVATAKLFDVLLQLKSQHPVYRSKNIHELNVTRLDKIKQYILKKLPEDCGVYYFLNKDQEIIYVGKSKNMYNRAVSHFNGKEPKTRDMLHELMNVDFIKTGSELVALLHEAAEIKRLKPKYNRARRASIFSHSIDSFTDENGVLNFKIEEYKSAENPMQSFVSYGSAREKLEKIIEEGELCLSFCGLTEKGSSCFNHHIKKCNGICINKESVDDYNKRAQSIMEKFCFDERDFVVIDKGRNKSEKAAILIENGKYAGYGYLDADQQLSSRDEILSAIEYQDYYPDMNDLVRSWLIQHPKTKKIKL